MITYCVVCCMIMSVIDLAKIKTGPGSRHDHPTPAQYLVRGVLGLVISTGAMWKLYFA